MVLKVFNKFGGINSSRIPGEPGVFGVWLPEVRGDNTGVRLPLRSFLISASGNDCASRSDVMLGRIIEPETLSISPDNTSPNNNSMGTNEIRIHDIKCFR